MKSLEDTNSKSRSRSTEGKGETIQTVPNITEEIKEQVKNEDVKHQDVEEVEDKNTLVLSYCPKCSKVVTRSEEKSALLKCSTCYILICDFCNQNISQQKYDHFCCHDFGNYSLSDWLKAPSEWFGYWAGSRKGCVQGCHHCPLELSKTRNAVRIWQRGCASVSPSSSASVSSVTTPNSPVDEDLERAIALSLGSVM